MLSKLTVQSHTPQGAVISISIPVRLVSDSLTPGYHVPEQRSRYRVMLSESKVIWIAVSSILISRVCAIRESTE